MAVQLKPSCLPDLLKYAVDERASDLHIRENKNVQLRIDSNLVQLDYETDSTIFDQFYQDVLDAIVAVKARLPIDESRIYAVGGLYRNFIHLCVFPVDGLIQFIRQDTGYIHTI